MHPEQDRNQLEQLWQLNAPLEEDEIRLNKDEVKRLWELGVFNDLAYFFCVIKAEITHGWSHRVEEIEDAYMFPQKLELTGADMDYLMSKWRGTTPKNEAGDLKALTADVIMKCLANLNKKDAAIPKSKQLTLFLGAEAPWTRTEKTPEEAFASHDEN
jgi:hypothetical protein